MKQDTPLGKLVLRSAAAFLFGSSCVWAPAQDDDVEDEVFELSPFLVDGSEVSGYRATTTLAGTRLKTQLRDVGSAISVLTQEFFEDTGGTDAGTILSYAVNMEVGGDQGNFAGNIDQNDQRTAPQNTQRVRGLSSATLTRNYFLTDIPFDTYNTEQVTINRGPNSLLFGIGSPGGVIENSVSQASYDNDFGEFTVRFGERSSFRANFDVNRSLIDGRLGVRIAGLRDDNKFQQEPAFEEDERLYLAAKALLFQGGDGILGPTTLRGNVEIGKITSNRPDVTPELEHGLSQWFELPDTSLDGVYGIDFPDYFYDGSWYPKWTADNRDGWGDGFQKSAAHWGQIGVYYGDVETGVAGGVFHNSPVQASQGRTPTGYTDADGNYIPIRDRLLTDRFNLGAGWENPTLPYSVWDNTSRLLTGDYGRVVEDFDAWSATIEQSLFSGKGGIEVTFDRQQYDNRTNLTGGFPWNNADVFVDISEYLTNGEPNPNLGRPVANWYAFGQSDESAKDNEAFRATAFYELDLSDRDGWLGNVMGRHVFTGFYSDQTLDWYGESYKMSWDSNDIDLERVLGAPIGAWERNVNTLAYLGPSLLDSSIQSIDDVRLTQSLNLQPISDGDAFSGHVWDPADSTWKDVGLIARRTLSGGGINRQSIQSQVAAWQGFLFGGNLVGMVGYREDDAEKFERVASGDTPNGTYLLPDRTIDPSTIVLAQDPDLVVSGHSVTKSLVAHVPDAWNPFSDQLDLSFHWNESENFEPSAARRNILGQQIAAPSGETTDFGATFVLNNRVSIRLNWYETNSVGASLNNGFSLAESIVKWSVSDLIWRLNLADRSGMSWDDSWAYMESGYDMQRAIDSGDPRPTDTFGSYEAFYAALKDVLPDETRDITNIRIDNGELMIDPINGLSSTTDLEAEGFEIDIVGNLTDNWRMSLNIGQQETLTGNSAPLIREIGPQVKQNLIDGGFYWLLPEPTTGATWHWGPSLDSLALTPLAAALAKDGTVSDEQREWRANFVTSYDFSEDSLLSGFGVGGAFRYQSKVAVGYPLEDPDGDLVFLPVLDNPVWGPEEKNVDLWFSYRRSLKEDRVWKSQINIRNAFGDNDPIPILANADGTISRYRNPNTREIYWTNTIEF